MKNTIIKTVKASKKSTRKTGIEKQIKIVEKFSKEIEKIQVKKMDLLKVGDNRKMEEYYFYVPSINAIESFNTFVNLLSASELNSDIKLIHEFTKVNSICNKDRCVICRNYCYCDKVRHQQHNLSSRFNILLAYLKDKDLFWDRISKQIDYEVISLLRIHTEGDFFSSDYVNEWFNIMYKHSNVKFYAYTKQFEYFQNVDKLPDNFYLELSFDTLSEYDLPVDIINKGNVNIYLTYRNMEEVEGFISKHNLSHMQVFNCVGKCKACRNCYTNKGSIHLCKLH